MTVVEPWQSQDRHEVRLEWGPDGAVPLARYAAERGSRVLAVVVDVLSFTTCVTVAADRGTTVLPFPWRDDRATAFAAAHSATLAGPRGDSRSSITLSPGSIRSAVGVDRLVLPSPNGSTTSTLLEATGATVVAASLRNRSAVAAWLVARLEESVGRRLAILLVPSGERWGNGTLRPAVEDLWGAGSVADALVRLLDHRAGPALLSPEAEVALASWRSAAGSLADHLTACASGRELIEKGWGEDVSVARELDSSSVVPVLVDGAFRDLAEASLPDGAPEG